VVKQNINILGNIEYIGFLRPINLTEEKVTGYIITDEMGYICNVSNAVSELMELP
jgi:hypothetical protein